MAIKEYQSTSTFEKIELGKAISKKIKIEKDEWYITMIGSPDSQSRHYDECEAAGGSIDKMVIIDRCRTTLEKNIKEHRDNLSHRGNPTFICCDVNEFLKTWDNTKKIGVIDFDGTSPASSYHLDLANNAKRLNAKFLIIVTTQRDRMCKVLLELGKNLPQVWRRSYIRKEQQEVDRNGYYKNNYSKWGWWSPVCKEILRACLNKMGLNTILTCEYKGVGKMSATVYAL